jgi:hypothetical protein
MREFLGQDVLGVPDLLAGLDADVEIASVNHVIHYAANVLGAVHVDERPDPLQTKMLALTWTATYTTPGGQFTAPVVG